MRLLVILVAAYGAIHSVQMLKAEAARVSEVINIATHSPQQLTYATP
jgi:hypothetical protein